ncbi:MAG: amidohydrolase family protein [Bryobacter sp.]|jgi:predicted TIM-barrel fold metal-dependent hydrolase|nr:amidohydrolase family protein [Bryobacter sp. CoA8 C33]
MTRRLFLSTATAALAQQKLPLEDFQPKSMLRVPQTPLRGPAFPVLDFHAHLSWAARSQNGVALTGDRKFICTPNDLLPVMDRQKIRTLINLTGGYGSGLKQAVDQFDRAHPGRFLTMTEPAWAEANTPNYSQRQVDLLEQAKRDGARGLKVLKTLGLYLRDNTTSGKLLAVDDKRFDPLWDACGRLALPVAIHVSDPIAFFLPTDRFNERFEELNNHPDWSFHGPGFPSNDELLAARNRVFARHPKTKFVALHVGNFAEDLQNVAAALDKYPNLSIDIAARIGELGRQPRASRRFFDKYQDRILFGTDAVPGGKETPQQIFGDQLYEIYYRFLETEDEYFDYAPAPVPPQGRWQIYGLGLPRPILKKIYYNNAARLLNLISL